ncbi:tetratricopeptide repeat protein [Gallaecimonas sp. GXIMD4217]|uniref:YfgM family protein n=1 Tax=Gallaecimonas sp. GXIMD4217 TaxID=3131927 RepID=UPI00311B11DB
MEIYSTEEQQVEAIKRFWREHGNAIVVGTVLGLAGIYGWRWYSNAQLEAQGQASEAYTQAVEALNAGDQAKAEAFIKGDSAGHYQALMAATLAKSAVEAGELDKALGHLDQAINQSEDEQLKQIFTLRKVRILIAQDKGSDAESLLATVSGDAFKAEVAELKGDIALARQDYAAARQSYQAALDASEGQASSALELKLDQLESKG